MTSQVEEPPTLEQRSYYSAKSKDGETMEFETTLKIRTKPAPDESWDIDYNVPQEPDGAETPEIVKVPEKEVPPIVEEEKPKTEPPKTIIAPPLETPPKEVPKDIPPSPLDSPPPSSEGSSFILPDPCEAFDKLENAVKGVFSSIFNTTQN